MPVKRYRTLQEVIEAVTADTSSSDLEDEAVEVCILPPHDVAQSETDDVGEELL